jgi:hypothetical protein
VICFNDYLPFFLLILPVKYVIVELMSGGGKNGVKMYPQNVLERRRNERYKVNGPAYAAIGPDFCRMGHIINISRSGLAFSYIHKSGLPELEMETRIQISDNNETLCEIPFISVSDTDGDLADPHSSVEIRLHRGCFGKLNRHELESLIEFLGNKTSFRLV